MLIWTRTFNIASTKLSNLYPRVAQLSTARSGVNICYSANLRDLIYDFLGLETLQLARPSARALRLASWRTSRLKNQAEVNGRKLKLVFLDSLILVL